MATATASISIEVSEYRFQTAGDGVDVVKRDGARYHVTVKNGEPVACTCRGFHFRRYCKHQGQVFDNLAEGTIRPAGEHLACGGCGKMILTMDANAWPTNRGLRFLCDGCDEDLVLHADERVNVQ